MSKWTTEPPMVEGSKIVSLLNVLNSTNMLMTVYRRNHR